MLNFPKSCQGFNILSIRVKQTLIILICFRFHGHSEKRVLEHFVNSDERQAGRDKYNYSSRHKKARYSPDYKRRDDKRPTAASETEKTRMRLVNRIRIRVLVHWNGHSSFIHPGKALSLILLLAQLAESLLLNQYTSCLPCIC